MSNHERIKWVSFTAITALAGLLIAIIANHTAFPELLFCGIVTVVIGVIVVLVGYAFLWERSASYIRRKMSIRKSNSLAREYFDDFRDFVNRFTSLREFSGGVSQGITGLLMQLGGLPKNVPKREKKVSTLINMRINNFSFILQNPLNELKLKLDNLHWKKKEINYEFLSCLVKDFENYVMLHKRLYVDFTVTMAREIGLDNIPKETERAYSEYKDDYNQFIIAYAEFGKRSRKARLGIFSEYLQKASEL